MLFNIPNTYEITKKHKIESDKIKNYINNSSNTNLNSQIILNKITDIIIDNTHHHNNDINVIINEYIGHFDGDDDIAYKMTWCIMMSYYLENIINDAKSSYFNINYDNFKSYLKLFGIKQYKKGNFYKIRIEWIFNLFNEDKNASFTLANLIKYCHWLVMNEEKNNFIIDLYLNDDNDDDDIIL